MSLSDYHAKYVSQPDEEIARRAKVKEEELRRIFGAVQLGTIATPIRLAVMGCGEKRFIQHHRDIFQSVLGQYFNVDRADRS